MGPPSKSGGRVIAGSLLGLVALGGIGFFIWKKRKAAAPQPSADARIALLRSVTTESDE